MKKWKACLALVLALVLSLSLAACAGNDANTDGDDQDNDIAGSDWRTTGIVRDSGTITRDGEDTTVLVCINKDDADFYLDSEVQTLFGYVTYPDSIAEPWDSFQGIDFSDRNGDGSSDVCMVFQVGIMIWYWDSASEEFVYQEDASLEAMQPDSNRNKRALRQQVGAFSFLCFSAIFELFPCIFFILRYNNGANIIILKYDERMWSPSH